jgi:hypothetical protein
MTNQPIHTNHTNDPAKTDAVATPAPVKTAPPVQKPNADKAQASVTK